MFEKRRRKEGKKKRNLTIFGGQIELAVEAEKNADPVSEAKSLVKSACDTTKLAESAEKKEKKDKSDDWTK